MGEIINLNNGKMVGEYKPEKYSELIAEFFEPYLPHFPDNIYLEEILDYAVGVWNYANITIAFKAMREADLDIEIPDLASFSPFTQEKKKIRDILDKMLAKKIKDYSEFTNFFLDCKISDFKNIEDFKIKATTQDSETYIDNMFKRLSQNDLIEEEGYIDRIAISVKPNDKLKHFLLENISNFKETDFINTTTIFLFDQNNEDEKDKWLKSKFEEIFEIELEKYLISDTIKMIDFEIFKEYFCIEYSEFVFDFEEKPILKGF